jgi:hypothetical protein
MVNGLKPWQHGHKLGVLRLSSSERALNVCKQNSFLLRCFYVSCIVAESFFLESACFPVLNLFPKSSPSTWPRALLCRFGRCVWDWPWTRVVVHTPLTLFVVLPSPGVPAVPWLIFWLSKPHWIAQWRVLAHTGTPLVQAWKSKWVSCWNAKGLCVRQEISSRYKQRLWRSRLLNCPHMPRSEPL